MKYKNLYLAVLLFTGLCSCENWLDVEPKTEIKYDKMFETETGFKDALIGVYLMMTDSMTYGREMNVTFLDVLGQQYQMSNYNKYYNALAYYDYDKFRSTVENLWIKNYRAIANLNSLLEALEDRKEILHPTNYANIKAEALGLRAFIHLDLLRMFGFGDCAAHPENLEKLSIPYVTEYSKKISEQLKQKDVFRHIQEDLSAAEELSGYYSPYNQVQQDENYELPNEDGFYKTYRSRFNYWAIRATQARAYIWEGKYKEALNCLERFIGETNPPIAWVDPDGAVHVEQKKQDLIFIAENIFYLNVTDLYKRLRPYVESYETESDFTITRNNDYFYLEKERVDELYEATSGVGISDIRYMKWFTTNSQKQEIRKFYEPEDSESAAKNKIPLIRKPETFYMAAECYNALNQPDKAVGLLNRVRLARGILYANNLPAGLSKDEVDREIEKEWRKEYISEGQMFFYYKRLGKVIPNSTRGAGNDVFVLPMPDKEIEIGGREDYK